MDNIIVVGTGHDTTEIAAKLAKEGIHDAVIVTPDNAKEIAKLHSMDKFNQPIRITAPYPMPTEKGFVCTGKHQYQRTVKNNIVNWICECGRKTTD
jgi:hypothetical protein